MEHNKTYAAALEAEELEQEPEAVTDSLSDDKYKFSGGQFNSGYVSVGGSGAATEIAPPDTLDEEFKMYESTGFVSAAIHQYADDVTQPGVRVTADSEETENWFEDEFLPQAGIVGGQRHQEFSQFLYQDVIQFLAAGNILDENVKNANDKITGFMHINPASCKALTEPNKPILRAPESHKKEWWGKGDAEFPKNPRGEAAAFSQYHPESVLGQKGVYDDDKEQVLLSLNDVTYRPRTPPAGEIWGIPIMRNIKEELTEFKNIRRDLARAIRTKAWGIWSVSFDTEVIETKDEVLVEGWDPDEMDNFTEGVGSMEPGELVGHDGSISFEKMQGDVPEEVLEVLEAYVKLIVSSLPPPLYAVGFEDNINQFVVKEQEEIYESSVESMQTTLSNTWTPTLKQVAKDHGKDPSGLELEISPAEDASPIRSMEVDDLEKFALYADGLSGLFGDDAYRAFNPEIFADLITQLPADAFKEEAFVGVPGGVPNDVNLLPLLQEMQDAGRISHRGIERIQDRVKDAKDAGDVTTRSLYVNPFAEQTGGQGGPLGGSFSDDSGGGGEPEEERNPDGTLAGRESST